MHNLNAYFYGVARLVFAESLKTREREQEAHEQAAEIVEPPPAAGDSEETERHACLQRCLQGLTEENRYLIIEYYQDDKSRKIARRKGLAARLGIPLNALRIRAHRIRAGLEACTRKCMEQAA